MSVRRPYRPVGSADESGPGTPARRWPLAGAVLLLVATNLVTNSVSPDWYLLWTSLSVLALVLLARADGLRRQQWGLGRVDRRAVRAALVVAAVVGAAMLVGTQLPLASEGFRDVRVADLHGWQVALNALVRVPLGTVLLEEVAFRGVLLAMLATRYGRRWAVALSSLAFGVWHVLPSWDTAATNAAVGSALGSAPLLAVVFSVVGTGLAGVLFCFLRLRYDHLVVPMALHWTTNGLGYLLAWLVVTG